MTGTKPKKDNMNFFKRWGEGIKNLDNKQQMYVQMNFFLGGAFGMGFAIMVLLARKNWVFVPFLLFVMGQQYLSAVNVYQGLKKLNVLKELAQAEENELLTAIGKHNEVIKLDREGHERIRTGGS